MEQVRKFHNFSKKTLIQNFARKGQYVLDVGCGFGGDLKKWSDCGVILDACDPLEESLVEARSRAQTLGLVHTRFFHGDILACPERVYDIICYNFSLHYIFQSRDLFFKSIRAIRARLRKGCRLIGYIPDSESILMSTPFKDPLGNFITRTNVTGYGAFGEKIFVCLADTPFYKDGARAEPIAYKDLLITHLEELGVQLESWEPLIGEHAISSLYSRFIFVCK